MTTKKKVQASLEPTFDKQMNYSLGEQNTTDPIFSNAYHAFIEDILKKRDKDVAKEIVDEFGKKVAEHYDPIMALLQEMEKGQKKLSADISDIKIDMGHMKCDFVGMRQQMKIIKDDNEKVHQSLKKQIEDLRVELTPIKEKASWKAIIWRGVIIALCAVLATLLLLYLTFEWFQIHHLGLLSLFR